MMKEISTDIVCIFEITYVITIYHYNYKLIKCYRIKLFIIYHMNIVTKPPRTFKIFFQLIFHGIFVLFKPISEKYLCKTFSLLSRPAQFNC